MQPGLTGRLAGQTLGLHLMLYQINFGVNHQAILFLKIL